jgi:hypothetical protein
MWLTLLALGSKWLRNVDFKCALSRKISKYNNNLNTYNVFLLLLYGCEDWSLIQKEEKS